MQFQSKAAILLALVAVFAAVECRFAVVFPNEGAKSTKGWDLQFTSHRNWGPLLFLVVGLGSVLVPPRRRIAAAVLGLGGAAAAFVVWGAYKDNISDVVFDFVQIDSEFGGLLFGPGSDGAMTGEFRPTGPGFLELMLLRCTLDPRFAFISALCLLVGVLSLSVACRAIWGRDPVKCSGFPLELKNDAEDLSITLADPNGARITRGTLDIPEAGLTHYLWRGPVGQKVDLLLKAEVEARRLVLRDARIMPTTGTFQESVRSLGLKGLRQLRQDLGDHFGVDQIVIPERIERTTGASRWLGPGTYSVKQN